MVDERAPSASTERVADAVYVHIVAKHSREVRTHVQDMSLHIAMRRCNLVGQWFAIVLGDELTRPKSARRKEAAPRVGAECGRPSHLDAAFFAARDQLESRLASKPAAAAAASAAAASASLQALDHRLAGEAVDILGSRSFGRQQRQGSSAL